MVVVAGLIAFGVVFALNSAVHSYLILAYTDSDKVAMNVGFYYMANAGGRLAGTVLSGLLYQWQGLEACLWASVAFILGAAMISLLLPRSELRARSRGRLTAAARAKGGQPVAEAQFEHVTSEPACWPATAASSGACPTSTAATRSSASGLTE